jgi:hypothetical protein
MKPSRWLVTTLSIFVLLAVTGVVVNIYVDIYGLYRSTKCRHLVDYGDNRIAKYLLSEHYVPDNFEAILIGPSVSSNWNTHGIHTFRTYNESLNGSNFVEQECLVQQAVASPGRLRLAMIVVHPSMTADHDFSTVRLTERERWSALGSLSLFDAYKDWFGRYRHPGGAPISDDYGTDFFEDPRHLNATAARLMRPGAEFPMDQEAVAAFRRILAACRQHHVAVLYVVPPTAPSIFEPKRAAFGKYLAFIQGEQRPGEQIIDLESQKFNRFICNPSNFSDGVHISRAGTPRIVGLLDRELGRLKENGLL